MIITEHLFSKHKLARRVLTYILILSVLLSLISAFIQLYSRFHDEKIEFEKHLKNIQISYSGAISLSLWDFNESLIRQQIEGLVNLPNIEFVKVVTDFNNEYKAGNEKAHIDKTISYYITYGDNEVGELIIYASYAEIYEKLTHQASIILLGELIKTFVIVLLLFLIVHKTITRHIYHITDYSKYLTRDNLDEPLTLSRHTTKDELGELVDAINKMRLNLKDEIIKLEVVEGELLQVSGELEIKVFDRTKALEASNVKLKTLLSDLTLAKDKLVQSEKMASLGQLVAGVAHEVNTPLGICVTSVSALKEKNDELLKDIEDGKLTRSTLSSTLNVSKEYQSIIEKSLDKAVELISNFKSLAVEQHTDPEVDINLANHVSDVLSTVKTLFKYKKYQFILDLDKDLNAHTFPSAWNQILTNLLMNSHIHGFENQTEGVISITLHKKDEQLIMAYHDDGKGIESSLINRIFEPFVTTKRGQGGSGLGLNIVYNLVTSKLGGTIEHLEVEQGTSFYIKVPFHVAKSNEYIT